MDTINAMALLGYTLDPEASPSGTSLREQQLPALDAQTLRAVLGAPVRNAYYEPDRGYDGLEWYFRDAEGNVLTVYDRWGMLRVGARPGVHVHDFIAALTVAVRRGGAA